MHVRGYHVGGSVAFAAKRQAAVARLRGVTLRARPVATPAQTVEGVERLM